MITFSTDRYSDISMFNEVAHQLLSLIGHSGTVPGAILAEDVPAALQRLKQATEGDTEVIAGADDGDDGGEGAGVSLKNRALPLIALFESAQQNKSNVMWR
ncbi:DUF1840 domain-containing protein [Methylovorus glucosotrophus]|uniref:DUF1840 domain-containing protein n=1 Tax=Methylovorus glucosotrophus (strain SIP3-4) TaxID=582744 RepID=C6XCL7_METGS|nr:DUF1840 domain-containing protein [Methylovorus glucosotrophus]ACT50292.1 Domain of unknown function DUF1840 [Methylovorus glucosotrophus SIP3-4]KAF0844307.1 uncharacterized protein DUF1840 [Methylovorus glucosotrophus]